MRNFKGNAEFFLGKRGASIGLSSTILKVKVIEDGSGTLVLCRPGVGVVLRVALYVWLSGFLIIGGWLFVTSLCDVIFSDAPFYLRNWLTTLAVSAIFVGAAVLYTVGKYFDEREKDYLIDFVRRTVSGYGVDL